MSDETRIRAAWQADRPYLLAVAAGMLGRSTDAEDVVQEAFARLAEVGPARIDDLRGWLIVVTRRLCLDRLRAAETRRTTATATPPEAGDDDRLGVDPADRLTLDDEVRRALTVLLDRLSPAERTSFVLHDVFGFPFDAVAELVGRTPGACRQLARRARLSLGAPEPARRPAPPAAQSAALADRFIAACAGGDVADLVELLDPAADGLAIVLGLDAPVRVHGLPAVAERAIAFFGPAAGVRLAPFALEGHAGVLARRGDAVVAVLRLDERAGRIRHLHAIALPLARS